MSGAEDSQRGWEACAKEVNDLKAEVAALTKKVEALTRERDEARKDAEARKADALTSQVADLLARLAIAKADFVYLAEECERTGRVDGITLAESRTWKVVGRLAREAGNKLSTEPTNG